MVRVTSYCLLARAPPCFTLHCLRTDQKWVLLLYPFMERGTGSEKLSGWQGHTNEYGIPAQACPQTPALHCWPEPPLESPECWALLAGLLAFEPLCVSGWLASVALAQWGLTERLGSSSTEGMCPLERKTPWGPRDRPAPCPVRWAGGSSPARKETICSPAGLRTALECVAEPSCS